MNNTIAIAWKEIKSYFQTPTAYVVGAMFLILTGIFFVLDATGSFAQASVTGFVVRATNFSILLAPLLTMRLLSEEQKLGTMELLLTAPVRDWEVVVGKILSGFHCIDEHLCFNSILCSITLLVWKPRYWSRLLCISWSDPIWYDGTSYWNIRFISF